MDKKVQKIIAERQLCSCMNTTKWRELQNAVDELPFPPPYMCKWVTDADPVDDFTRDVHHIGDWSEGALSYREYPFIEWIKVRPRKLTHQGFLIPPKVEDESELFEAILLKYNIPFEKNGATYVIYGYR